MILVVSASLHPQSRSRQMARVAAACLAERGAAHEWLDLAATELPFCNGLDCYGRPEVREVASRIAAAQGILLASPVYNFDLSSTAKNLIELTGRAWNDKVVGFICSAGGRGSYMAPMGLANSLMLDFRCLILPRYVFADDSAFADGQMIDPNLVPRIHTLVDQLIRLSEVWATDLRVQNR